RALREEAEELVREVGNDQADGRCRLPLQAARRFVRDVVQVADGVQDSGAAAGAHGAGAVQDVADRAHGDVGERRDVLHRRARARLPAATSLHLAAPITDLPPTARWRTRASGSVATT